jgi:hypothetical protein
MTESFEIRRKYAPSLGFRLRVARNRRPLNQSGSSTNQNTLIKTKAGTCVNGNDGNDVNNVMKGKLGSPRYILAFRVHHHLFAQLESAYVE